MPSYVLQEMSEEMGDGKKKIYPRMQTYSLHDFDTVVRHMHEYGGSFSEGAIRGVLDTLVTTMKSWMPLGHSIKIDGLGVFSLTLGFDTSTPSEATAAKKQKSGNADDEPKTKYRHVCIKGINFKPDPKLLQQMNQEATFERAETGVVVPRKPIDSRDERIRKALAVIDKQGYMMPLPPARPARLPPRTFASWSATPQRASPREVPTRIKYGFAEFLMTKCPNKRLFYN